VLESNISLHSEKIDMEDEKYQLFFSFENVYAVMRRKSGNVDSQRSEDYEFIKFDKHNCLSFKDFLIDIMLLLRTGELDLKRKDMVCIRINGFLSCFQYNGYIIEEINEAWKNFAECKKFLYQEYHECIKNIHRQNKVLSVLDGRLFHVANIDLNVCRVFAIDTEIYDYIVKDMDNCVISEYSLYTLDEKCRVQIMNPYNKTFQTLKNALFYLKNNKNKRKNTILVHDRQEIEMIIDYYELQKLVILGG